MLKKFNYIFGINSKPDEGKEEFMNRMDVFIQNLTYYDGYEKIFVGVCFELGLNPEKHKTYEYLSNRLRGLLTIAKGKFIEVLKVVSALYSFYKKNYHWEEINKMDKEIPHIISLSTTDIGVRWVEGFFYPDNIPEIDNAVVDETLSMLSDFPAARGEMHNALVNLTNRKHDQVLALCYKALENVIQQKTGIGKSLHEPALQTELLRIINVSDCWRAFLANFVKYANEFGRHGKNPDRHNVDAEEVESYLYFTFIMLKMIIRKVPG